MSLGEWYLLIDSIQLGNRYKYPFLVGTFDLSLTTIQNRKFHLLAFSLFTKFLFLPRR